MCCVTSWRDAASQQAQDDLDGLLIAALPFAQQMLERHGEFFPYGMALGASGDTRMVAAQHGQGKRPPSTEVIALLVEGLRRERDTMRAVAFVADVRSIESDAVRVVMEHQEGPAMAVLLPYKKKRLRKGVEFGSLIAVAATPVIWT
jgi:hypothetical protein